MRQAARRDRNSPIPRADARRAAWSMVHGLATLTLSGAYGDADPEALALQCAHQLFRGPDPGVVLAPPG